MYVGRQHHPPVFTLSEIPSPAGKPPRRIGPATDLLASCRLPEIGPND
jgi:hypothetical protein